MYGIFVFLIGLLVIAVVFYAVRMAADTMELDPQARKAVLTITGLVCIILILVLALRALGVWTWPVIP